MEYVALPFPSPDSFGDNVAAVLFWDKVNQRYEYWVFRPLELYNRDYRVTFSVSNLSNNVASNCSLIVQDVTDTILHLTYYRLWYYPESSYYSFSNFNVQNTDAIFRYSGPSGVSVDCSRLAVYGDIDFYSPSIAQQVAYTFNNDISPYVFKQMSSDLGEIKLYCSEILEALGSGSDYAPPETTVNSAINDYNQAEQELMENQFANIDDVVDVIPDLKGGKDDNAIKFLSSNMNFVAGSSDYGNSEYQSSMSKLYSVFIIVLGLGFTSFIIGLVNRRKE